MSRLEDTPDQAYRSLSVLALIGFGISALYAAVTLLLGLVALISRNPMPALNWTLLFPVTGGLLCVAARVRIAFSEGTLAGKALTGWGLALSLLIVAGYGAYAGAVYFALKQQSEVNANKWLELLRQRQTARAFWRAMPPPQRAGIREEDPNLLQKLRNRMSSEMSMPGGGGGGMFSHFLEQDLIRAVKVGGPNTTFVLNGVKSIEQRAGSSRVVLSYRITTPDCSFDALIAVENIDGKGSEGQEWGIDMSGTNWEKDTVVYTESGKAMMELIRRSRGFVDEWQGKEPKGENPGTGMRDPSGIGVHLLTLPEGKERDSAGVLLRRRPAVGIVAGGVASSQGRPDIVAAFQRTCRGDCVTVAADALLDPAVEKKALAGLRVYFAPGPREHRKLEFKPGTSHPSRELKGDVVQLGFDNAIQDEDQGLKVNFVLLLEADAAALHQTTPPESLHWRFAGLKVTGAMIKPPDKPRR
jgi:hypothetical protein